MSSYLGIDYGATHIGLAYAEHQLATPLPTMSNNHTTLTALVALIAQKGITRIVCGLPDGPLTPQVQEFAHNLTLISGIPVILYPETLSTHEAQHKLRQSGASRQKIHNDHAYAACLILEDYLEYGK